MKPHFGLEETFGPRSHSILQRLDNATSLIVCLKDPVFQVTKRFPVVWIPLSVDPVTRVPRLVTGKWSQETGQENGGVRQGKEDGQKKKANQMQGASAEHAGAPELSRQTGTGVLTRRSHGRQCRLLRQRISSLCVSPAGAAA